MQKTTSVGICPKTGLEDSAQGFNPRNSDPGRCAPKRLRNAHPIRPEVWSQFCRKLVVPSGLMRVGGISQGKPLAKLFLATSGHRLETAAARGEKGAPRPHLCLAGQREKGMSNAGGYGVSNSSRTIEFDRFNFAIMAMHVQCDGTATDFAILNRGKCAGRSVNDRGEDRSAVGANNA